MDHEDVWNSEFVPLIPKLTGFAISLTQSTMIHYDDLVQETLISAYKNLHQYEANSNAYAWLARIMTNRLYSLLRPAKNNKHLHVPLLVTFADGDQAERTDLPTAESAEDTALFSEFANQDLVDAMNSLSDIHRDVIQLVVLEGLSQKQACERLNIPMGTLSTRVMRALEKIREYVDDATVLCASVECGERFTPASRRQKYCSPRCRPTAVYRPDATAVRQCELEGCTETFETRARGGRRFCTAVHAKANVRVQSA